MFSGFKTNKDFFFMDNEHEFSNAHYIDSNSPHSSVKHIFSTTFLPVPSLQFMYFPPMCPGLDSEPYAIHGLSLLVLNSGTCFSKVRRTLRARKASCQTAIRLF